MPTELAAENDVSMEVDTKISGDVGSNCGRDCALTGPRQRPRLRPLPPIDSALLLSLFSAYFGAIVFNGDVKGEIEADRDGKIDDDRICRRGALDDWLGEVDGDLDFD